MTSPTAPFATSPTSSPTAGRARRCSGGVSRVAAQERAVDPGPRRLPAHDPAEAVADQGAGARTSSPRRSTDPKTACPQYVTCPVCREARREATLKTDTDALDNDAQGAAEGAEAARRDSTPSSPSHLTTSSRWPKTDPAKVNRDQATACGTFTDRGHAGEDRPGRARLVDQLGERPCERE